MLINVIINNYSYYRYLPVTIVTSIGTTSTIITPFLSPLFVEGIVVLIMSRNMKERQHNNKLSYTVLTYLMR